MNEIDFTVIQLSYSHFHFLFIIFIFWWNFQKKKQYLSKISNTPFQKNKKKHQFQLLTDKKNVTWFLKNEKKRNNVYQKSMFSFVKKAKEVSIIFFFTATTREKKKDIFVHQFSFQMITIKSLFNERLWQGVLL